jgi:hypothetical protein
LVGLLCGSDKKMHFFLAGGSWSSSEELSIARSITSTFFLLALLATVTEQGLLKTLGTFYFCVQLAGYFHSFFLWPQDDTKNCHLGI